MKNIKQYKRIKNTPRFNFGKPSGFGMPGSRVLGYEPGTPGDSSGWSNVGGNSLQSAIKQGKAATKQANIAGTIQGLSPVMDYAKSYLSYKDSLAQSAPTASTNVTIPGMAGASSVLTSGATSGLVNSTGAAVGTLSGASARLGAQLSAEIGKNVTLEGISPAVEQMGQQLGSNAAKQGVQQGLQQAANVAGYAMGGAAALYNGINLINALSDMPVVDADTMKSTQSHGTAMANGVQYQRKGSINIGDVESLQDVYDAQTNAAIRSSSMGLGAGIGGAIGTAFGGVGGLIGSGIGALIGGIAGLFGGDVDQTEEARDLAKQLNETTELENLDSRDRAASKGKRNMFYNMTARNGKIAKCSTGKTTNKSLNTSGILLPLRNYGKYIG